MKVLRMNVIMVKYFQAYCDWETNLIKLLVLSPTIIITQTEPNSVIHFSKLSKSNPLTDLFTFLKASSKSY